jgi:hypothetical protein
MSLTWVDYLEFGAISLLGQMLHILWVKIPSLKKKSKETGKPWSLKEWLSEDWNITLGVFVVVMTLFFVLDQILHFKPEVADYTKLVFWGVGAFGSSVGFAKFSSYEAELGKLVDVKANIADLTIGLTTKSAEAIAKGTRALGTDVTQAPQPLA